jgi:hypothetical protein
VSNPFAAFENLTPLVDRLAVEIRQQLLQEAIPPAAKMIAAKAADIFRSKLPDGVASGTRAKQSAKSRARFPYHMRGTVRTKAIQDNAGILVISGVDSKGRHVRFDFGKKAATVGREHILWGKGPANPPMRIQRKQLQDIPGQVKREIGPIADATIRSAVLRALQNVT